MNGPHPERRHEPRRQASGPIEFLLSDPIPLQFQGELLDISTSGFRASHRNRQLRPGQQVSFRHATGEGAAKVIWTRIVAGNVETGFLIL